MGIERSKLSAILRTVKVDYFGEVLTVTYKPDAMTPAKEEELAEARKAAQEREESDDTFAAAENADLLATRLASVLAGWDVLEDGVLLPTTRENLRTFPNALLVHISMAIGEDMAPKVKTRLR